MIYGKTGHLGKGIFLFCLKVGGFGTACVTGRGVRHHQHRIRPLAPTSATPHHRD